MSQEHIDRDRTPDQMSLDELIASAKADLNEAPPKFEAQLPPEYADLAEEETLYYEETEDDGPRVPGVIKVLLYLCCVLAAAVLLGVGAWKCADDVLALTAEEEIVTVTVPENVTMAALTEDLADKGLVRYKWLFSLYCMVSNAEEKINPGTYELNTVYDYHALVNGMIATSEDRATATVMIPEGYELDDIFALLQERGVCSVEQLQNAAATYAFSSEYVQNLPYGDYRRLEGYLFPDTYEFYVNDTPENVLSKFLKNFDAKITAELLAALDELNVLVAEKKRAGGFTEQEIADSMLDFHDVIIVASLIEKETTRSSESGSISSVIYNRLCSKLYPCLNIDATIQYVLPERKDTLTLADKSVVSPYNTYTNAGLPVGPIANPGINSIRAALYPADTDYYFYALDPGGFNHFSSNYYDHEEYLRQLRGEALPEQTDEETTPEETTNENG